jgi:hypothetical protein
MSWDRNAGQRHSIKSDNIFFVIVENFRYLGTTEPNQNSIQEQINRIEFRECLLSFGSETFDLYSDIQKFEDIYIYIYIYNFSCVVWVWNLVAHIEGGT